MTSMHKPSAVVDEAADEKPRMRAVSATDQVTTVNGGGEPADAREVGKRWLPLIWDVGESRDSPSPGPTPGFELTDTTGMVRGVVKRKAEGSAEGPVQSVAPVLASTRMATPPTPGTAQGLRSSSQNSVRVSRQPSPASAKSPSPSEKENMCRASQAMAPRSVSRSGSRWVRVGARKGDGMVQGIRSLFR